MAAQLPSFPPAQQAQIIRAQQRDLFHVSSLREDAESVFRSWLGTRWLTRWDKEVDLLVKLVYYGLTTGRATQTLGEEYTDIWQHAPNSARPPSAIIRLALVLLPTCPSYLISRLGPSAPGWMKTLSSVLQVLTEINLAVFYLKGTYYDLAKRVLRVKHFSSIPENPHTRPPSYALLGVLLGIRLVYRLRAYLLARVSNEEGDSKGESPGSPSPSKDTYLDGVPISTLIHRGGAEQAVKPAEEDTNTALSFASIPPALRASRMCTLCLEERTDSTATECGHLFCWTCIINWGREKAECPLCRQGLSLNKLMPIYNL